MIREATIHDYQGMHRVRIAVKENALSNPDLITQQDYIEMITTKGKGWVYTIGETIVGFSVIDISTKNIWALFIDPEHEKKGVGKALFNTMMDWGFKQNIDSFWLSTSPGTRAEQFYHIAGWRATGTTSSGEVKFEITKQEYRLLNK